MMRSLVFDDGSSGTQEITAEEFPKPGPGEGAVWIDLVKPTEEQMGRLQASYNLHPLAVRATVSPLKFPTPRTEIYDGSAYIRWYYINPTGRDLEFLPVNIFVGEGYLITITDDKVKVVDELYAAAKSGGLPSEGSAGMLHKLLDVIVDDFFPLVDEITDRVDALEDLMFEDPSRAQLRELFDHKHSLLTVHKIISPQRETINVLTRFKPGFIDEAITPYFLDIYDHLVQLGDIVDTCRDVINGAMDIYLSAIDNRMNRVMRRLTVVATIFLPLTLITGIFGMNLPFVANNTKAFYISLAVSSFFVALVVVINREKRS